MEIDIDQILLIVFTAVLIYAARWCIDIFVRLIVQAFQALVALAGAGIAMMILFWLLGQFSF